MAPSGPKTFLLVIVGTGLSVVDANGTDGSFYYPFDVVDSWTSSTTSIEIPEPEPETKGEPPEWWQEWYYGHYKKPKQCLKGHDIRSKWKPRSQMSRKQRNQRKRRESLAKMRSSK